MPTFFVPASAGIKPGDTLWEHHTNKNGNIVLSQQTNPDDNHVSNVTVGRATSYIGMGIGEQIEEHNGDLVVTAKSKGYSPAGTIVGRYTGRQVVAMPKPVDDAPSPNEESSASVSDVFNRQMPLDMEYDPVSGGWSRRSAKKKGK